MHPGRCTCGYVQYELTDEPMFVNACLCTWCQRETGSAFAVNAVIESDRVQLRSGDVEKVMTPSESGKGQQIHRCPKCRVALWSNYGGARDRVRFVRVGTLDEPARLPPRAFIFARSKPAWLTLPAGIPAFDVFYEYDRLWTPQERERRAQALKT